jgi:hypothetical protein
MNTLIVGRAITFECVRLMMHLVERIRETSSTVKWETVHAGAEPMAYSIAIGTSPK